MKPGPKGDDAISHLIAISMDAWGDPIGLFATNRWVTDETWYPAEMVIAMPRPLSDRPCISVLANQPLARGNAASLPPVDCRSLRHRDAVIAAQMKALPGSDVFGGP